MFYLKYIRKIYISPNPSDRGLALGCAYYGSFKKKQKIKVLDSPYLGSNYSDKEILKELINNNMKFFLLQITLTIQQGYFPKVK